MQYAIEAFCCLQEVQPDALSRIQSRLISTPGLNVAIVAETQQH
jgi:hypothetical protein